MRRFALMAVAGGLTLGLFGSVAAQDPSGPLKVAPPATVSSAPGPQSPPAAVPVVIAPAPPRDEPRPVKADKAKPADEPKPAPEPLKRPRFNAAIMQGVDKITAETLRFEVKVGEPVRYRGLILTVHACETAAADEALADSIAYVEVQSQPEVTPGRAAAPPRQVFRGWMFASSPTLHPFEHPVYDLWLIACKTAAPGA